MPSIKNAPRFLDYRRSPLPLDVALSLALPADDSFIGVGATPRDLVLSGRVHVNGSVERSCQRLVCRTTDRIVIVCNDGSSVAEHPVRTIPAPRYFVCYKPRGVICSSRRNEGIDRVDSVLISEWLSRIQVSDGGDGIGDALPFRGGMKPIETVGRLDEESEGLLLLTNDGSFSRLLCDPEFGLRKTYRVVVRGSGYGRLVARISQGGCDNEMNDRTSTELAKEVIDMMERGNPEPKATDCKDDAAKPHFPFEDCRVLDVGRLTSQHTSDDSYYALVDLVLREGKRHVVRRIVKNAGMRVCYLSRIVVEGLEGYYSVDKPQSIEEAWMRGFMPGGRHRDTVPVGKLVSYSERGDGIDATMLLPGHVMEIRRCDVDRIFHLRTRYADKCAEGLDVDLDMTADRNAACTVSRYTVPCVVCSKDIVPGDRMFCSAIHTPAEGGVTASKAKSTHQSLVWGHEMCFAAGMPPPPPCRHWKRLGRCPAKEMGVCAFIHDEVERGTSTTLDKQRWGGKRHFVRNQHKNSVFRIFLMQTYGMDYLNKNDGVVIDVAGGKGELSFELINLSGVIECVVIDPRPLNLSLVRSKWTKGLFEPKRTGMFSKWYPACEEGCKDRKPQSPGNMRCFFDSALFLKFVNAKDASAIEETNEHMRHDMERAKSIVWTTKGLQHEDGASYNEEGGCNDSTTHPDAVPGNDSSIHEASTSSSEIEDPPEARSILQRCHLIVGFHPDQAAGEVVEFAMARNVPWCIVPCCVYSDTFSQRKLKDGTKVKSYDHLVQWLCEKDPRARTATLDLEGKNTVVYTLPLE